MEKKFQVTPWTVEGEIDYEKLLKDFGTERISPKLLARINNLFNGLHPLLKRKIFYSHRDLDKWLDSFEKNLPIALYTGRGPSESTHLGHLIPWILTKWIQERTGAYLFFQFTDDEKFLFKRNLSLEDTKKYTFENMLDVAALGFDKRKTFFIVDTHHAGLLYPLAIQVAKRITFSTAKAVFGFSGSNNIGEIFYTSMQAVPVMLPKYLTGKEFNVLIPMGIDQDPHFRVARDVLPKIGYKKPSCLHSKFFPSLIGNSKMSASNPDATIYTSDPPDEVRRKIMKKAITGGRETLKKQRELGGEPHKCAVFQYFLFLFEEDDSKLNKRFDDCRSGNLMCGECKNELIERINSFLEKHRKKRERLKDEISDWLLSDSHMPK